MISCPECGYDLQAISSERCPECGVAFDRAALARSRIPWSHRNDIGWWRAYARTINLLIFKPGRLANEMYGPVSYDDAQLFRWIAIMVVTANLCGSLLYCIYEPSIMYRRSFDLYAITRWIDFPGMSNWFIIFSLAGIFIGVITLTGVSSYFFHPRWLPMQTQNRALALSYYPSGLLIPGVFCADLALLGAKLADLLGRTHSALAFRISVHPATDAGIACILLLGLGFLLAFVWNTLVLLRRTTHCGMKRMTYAALTLAASSIMVPFLALALPPCVYWIMLLAGSH